MDLMDSQRGAQKSNTSGANAKANRTLADVYKDLPINAEEEIRVVTLTPGKVDDLLDFEMKVVNIWDKNYAALSYRWMGTKSEEMRINGTLVDKVHSNLHCALTFIRANISSPLDLWFDAICINQGGEPEIKEQVLLMGELYANAKKTIVWLGAPNKQSISALSHFSSLRDTSLMSLMDRYDQDKVEWLNFGDGVMNREWWGRAWMVQEMVCAKTVMFMCGNQQIDLERFATLVDFTYSSGRPFTRESLPLSSEFHFRWQSFVEMYAARKMWQTRQTTTIAPWIYKFHSWGSTKKKDRIIAYLGLASDYRGEFSQVEWQDLYTQTTIHVIKVEGYTDFICLGRGPDRDPELPTWVPDVSIPYSAEARTGPLWCGWGSTHRKKYKASNDTPFQGSIYTSNNRLEVRARKVGEIKTISMPHDTGKHAIVDSRRLAFGENPRKRYPAGPETEWCEDALGSTLVWDLNYMEDRCTASQGFFMNEVDIPPGFLNSYLGQLRDRRKAWEAQLEESRTKYRLGRRFANVENPSLPGDMYAMVPPNTEVNDVIFVLTGATVPMVFRSSRRWGSPGDEVYELVGEW